jgi:hypothetical protein
MAIQTDDNLVRVLKSKWNWKDMQNICLISDPIEATYKMPVPSSRAKLQLN